ncbi:MAG: endonuclease/exonuclease/phosphatase family protein [Clostridia bacterium]|nr:endonuclease/exonuclease/phosphatase family protein [Clostridia bacterium]
MKLMSFNTQHCLNFLEQNVDYDIMAKTINDVKADIVGLNEMFDEGEGALFGSQTKKLSELTGLEHFYFAKAIIDTHGPYGNGFLSRYPIKKAETITIPDPNPREYDGFYETRCLLKAELENGITVLVTHFGLNPDEQKNAVKAVLEHIKSKKCILMGDFNIQPNNEILDPIREKMKDAAMGFCESKMSWPSDKPRIKIDYIFVSHDLEVITSDIPAIVASDHRPHIAEINI